MLGMLLYKTELPKYKYTSWTSSNPPFKNIIKNDLLSVHFSIYSYNGRKSSRVKVWREQTFSVALVAFSTSNSGEDVGRMKIRTKSII